MGPAQAIKTCLRKSFQFSGRASRSEFRWFAPIGLVLPVVVASQISWSTFEVFGIWRVGLLIAAALTLLAPGSRRLEDAGEAGHQIDFPFMPPILLWVGYSAVYWFNVTFPIFALGIVIGLLALLILVPAYLFALFTSFMLLGPTIGMLILPPKPNSNEVPS